MVRVGVLPDENEARLRERYGNFLDYLSERVGVPFELIVPRDYNQILSLFETGEIDVGYFGGVTFLKAHETTGAVPIAMRRVDLNFTTYILANASIGRRALEDYAGLRFAFGSELSTSGHIMPRYFLKRKGIEPETFFSEVRYSGAHDRSAIMVRDHEVDLAAVNALVVDQMFKDKLLKRDQALIVWETPPYPDYTWAARPGLSDRFYGKLLDAFLHLSTDDPTHASILTNLDADGFLPAALKDFEEVSEALGTLQH